MKTPKTQIGVIGGSGFYKLLDNPQEIRLNTPHGAPSSPVFSGKIGESNIAFIPRHGLNHQLPPHQVPYKANLWALKELGVTQVLTCTAVGSLQKEIQPGDFVILDQFIDRTRHRDDTFYHGPVTTHISSAYPYCPRLSKVFYQTAKSLKIKTHKVGTAVIIEGPRFSTAAESQFFTNQGWDVINMTQYPEVVLARELELCYAAVALVTDYDAGLMTTEKIKPVSLAQVLKTFNSNNQKALRLIIQTIKNLKHTRDCDCKNALANATL